MSSIHTSCPSSRHTPRPGSASSSAWAALITAILPSEGASNIAYCLFSFPSLADYESYRHIAMTDPESTALVASLVEKKFIVSYERSFLRPLLP